MALAPRRSRRGRGSHLRAVLDPARRRGTSGPGYAGRLRRPPVPAGGWRRVVTRPAPAGGHGPADVMLDLGATAKALAADRAAAAIVAAAVAVSGRLGGDPGGRERPTAVAGRYRRRRRLRHQHRRIQARQVVRRDGGLATSALGLRLAARWGGPAPHHRPRHRPARRFAGGRRASPPRAARCEHRQYRRDPARQGRHEWLAGLRTARPAGAPRRLDGDVGGLPARRTRARNTNT